MEFINYTSYNKAEDVKRLKFITDNLSLREKESLSILEIGCGNGNISYQLARYGHKVTAVDISQTTIDAANTRYGNTPGLLYKVADAEQLQLDKNDKFDVIVCSEVLEHLNQPEKLVNNFRNLLNKDGFAIVTVPNGNGPREAFITKPVTKIVKGNGVVSKFVRSLKNSLGYRGNNAQTSAESLEHIQFFTIPMLNNLAECGGFELVKKQAGNFVENVFPFSLVTKRLFFLQKIDCFLADLLPLSFTSSFYTVWKQKN